MPFPFCSKGAPVPVAPFAFWLLLFTLYGHDSLAAACPAREISERVTVVYVYDGDTVKLADGRRLRFIGINTPELRQGDRPADQTFAVEAKAALQSLIDRANRTLLLQYGREHTDHYGRLLAHAFLENGENVAAHLLRAGLATALVVPPNSWGQDCYQRQEDRARTEGRGIWGLPRYQARDAAALPRKTHGFRIVFGTVERVRHAGGNVWVDLRGPLSLRIARQDLVNFPAGLLEHLAGRDVETRGWVRSRPSGLVMTVRHPAALATLDAHAP